MWYDLEDKRVGRNKLIYPLQTIQNKCLLLIIGAYFQQSLMNLTAPCRNLSNSALTRASDRPQRLLKSSETSHEVVDHVQSFDPTEEVNLEEVEGIFCHLVFLHGALVDAVGRMADHRGQMVQQIRNGIKKSSCGNGV